MVHQLQWKDTTTASIIHLAAMVKRLLNQDIKIGNHGLEQTQDAEVVHQEAKVEIHNREVLLGIIIHTTQTNIHLWKQRMLLPMATGCNINIINHKRR